MEPATRIFNADAAGPPIFVAAPFSLGVPASVPDLPDLKSDNNEDGAPAAAVITPEFSIDTSPLQAQLQYHQAGAAPSTLTLTAGRSSKKRGRDAMVGQRSVQISTGHPLSLLSRSPPTFRSCRGLQMIGDGTDVADDDTDVSHDTNNKNGDVVGSGFSMIPFFGFAGGDDEEEQGEAACVTMCSRDNNLSPTNTGREEYAADEEENMAEGKDKKEDAVEETKEDAEETEVTCVALHKDVDGKPLSLQTNTEPNFSIAHKYLREFIIALQHEELTDNDEHRPNKVAKGRIAKSDATHRACISCKGCGSILLRPESFEHQNFYIGIMKQFRIHVKDCPEVPEAYKAEFNRLRNTKGCMRGRKSAWSDTARAIGLLEMVDSNGAPVGLTYLPSTCITEE